MGEIHCYCRAIEGNDRLYRKMEWGPMLIISVEYCKRAHNNVAEKIFNNKIAVGMIK